MPLKRTKEILLVFATYFMIILLLRALDNYLNITTIWGEFIYEISWRSLFCLIIFFVVKKIEKRNLDTLDIYFANMGKQLLWGIGLSLVFIIIPIIKVFVLHTMTATLSSKAYDITFLNIVPYIIIDLIFVGFTEELIFRGYLLSRVKEITNSNIIAIIISSAAFGLVHYPIERDIVQVISAFLMGFLFSYIKLYGPNKNCSLFSFSFAHGLYDTTLMIIGYLCYIFK